ncbi:RNA-binding protein [Streptosporangium violaceochromogenes]|nr:RNA-binding protein [Streptosporangium violaceochromogenes]
MTTPQPFVPAAVETSRRELFLLAARALADAGAREPDDRLAPLARDLAADDAWLRGLLGWARRRPALRGFTLAVAVEFAHARLAAKLGTAAEARRLIDTILVRADEPGELLAYTMRRFGRSFPKPIREGVARAAERLYDEHALATYDTEDAPLRFSEVIGLTHPKPAGGQREVFQYATLRLKHPTPVPDTLTTLKRRAELYAVPAERRPRHLDRPDIAGLLAAAGMGLRDVAAWLGGEMTGKAWNAVLPSMSLRERLAHLPALTSADLSAEVAERLIADLEEGEAVAREEVPPMEIWAACRSVPSSRWSPALESALRRSLAQVPALSGRTLVLVDRSAAMGARKAEAAAVFAAALALRSSSVEPVQFGPVTERVTVEATVPDTLGRFRRPSGTGNVAQAMREHADGHDRIIVLTHPAAAVEAAEAVTFPGHEHVITEVDDGWFAAVPAIELARTGAWPF